MRLSRVDKDRVMKRGSWSIRGSVDDYFLSIVNVQPSCGGLGIESSAVKGVPAVADVLVSVYVGYSGTGYLL
jgi:hypothetical protein